MDILAISSLSISILLIVVVIILAIRLNGRVTSQYHKDGSVELTAVVSEFSQRLKRLEEGLVDQKVKLEIFELRQQRRESQAPHMVGLNENQVPLHSSLVNEPSHNVRSQKEPSIYVKDGSRSRFGIEYDILRIVLESEGKATAKGIQQRIGRTREHTARMMNSLFHDGLVERDVHMRPFSYSITDKGREMIGL